MRRKSTASAAVGFVAALALAGSALGFSGITNGSFEAGAYANPPWGWQTLGAGAPNITGWTIASGDLDWIGPYWAHADGTKSLDLNGCSPATISQSFATTIGYTYVVTFSMAGNPAGPPVVKTVAVAATGAAPVVYSFDTTGRTLASMGWTTQTYSFLATANSTTLTFRSQVPSGCFGPALDNVSVTEVVPTKDDCKQGGWQSMLDATGASFKNQGDCVSYFATGGHNPGAGAP